MKSDSHSAGEKKQTNASFFSFSPFLLFPFLILFAVVLLLHGTAVPFGNEFAYLVQLEKRGQPGFLAQDWTFQNAGNEHWVFNTIFGAAATFAPIEFIGWTGRMVTWAILLVLLLRIGKFWEIGIWQTAAAIFLWLLYWQAPVGGEWMIGTFEAKSIAYVFLLLALVGFCHDKTRVAGILLGLTFSFHPSVGMWGALAAGGALLGLKTSRRKILEVVFLTALFSLPGILPLVGGQIGQAASRGDWQFIVEIQAPALFNPFAFSALKIVLLCLMLAFNVWAVWRSENFALRFLLYFQIAAGLIFLGGAAARFFEFYELLRLTPFRLFPLFTALFFTFTAFRVIAEINRKEFKIAVGACAAAAIFGLSPFTKAAVNLEENYLSHFQPPNDLDAAYVWLAKNAAPDAVTIQPPVRTDAWYLSRRAQIAGFSYPVYERLGEWRERINDLTGGREIAGGENRFAEISAAYDDLPQSQIEFLRQKYRAAYLVSKNRYSYPIMFETETYKIYRLE